MSVLVVEDEQPIRLGLKALLERHYPRFGAVTDCASAEEALAAFEAGPFDLVVTDIHLGGLSGLDLLRRIHALRPGTPLIVLSGHSEFNWAREAIKYGVRAYLLKPLDLKEFSEALDGIVPPLVPTVADEKARQVVKYLTEHLEEELDMTRVANSVNLNYSYFSGWFRDCTGLNFSDFLLRLRMDRARILLEDPTAMVADVARKVGYPDARTFSKAFHRVVGRAPSQDRFTP
jgi:two-component system response regulator YesN